jgi:uncharacterized protein HemX
MTAGKEPGKKQGVVGTVSGEFDNPELETALRNFRESVHAWGDAVYSMPRAATASATHGVAWRRPVAWVLSLALSAGMVSFGLHERYEQQAREAIAHQREMDRQRALEQEQAREAQEELARFDTELAKVDSDIAREVPAAMDPLAHLMEDGGGK